ncbi:MAG: hypothetical protein AAFO97_10445 [Pseudomonadota bacterium]
MAYLPNPVEQGTKRDENEVKSRNMSATLAPLLQVHALKTANLGDNARQFTPVKDAISY